MRDKGEGAKGGTLGGQKEPENLTIATSRGVSALEPVIEPQSTLRGPLKNLQRWDSFGSSWVSLRAS